MNRKGFTLIELIITIALMGIVCAIAIPRVNMSYLKLDNVTNELVYNIRLIRQENMKGNSAAKIEFSGQCVYQVFQNSSGKPRDIDNDYEYKYILPDNSIMINFSTSGLKTNNAISTITVGKVNKNTGYIDKGSTVKEIYINDFGAITVTEKKADNEK